MTKLDLVAVCSKLDSVKKLTPLILHTQILCVRIALNSLSFESFWVKYKKQDPVLHIV